MEVISTTSGDALGLVEDHAASPPPAAAGTRRPRRRRRPTGEPPPLPHHLQTTGVGWLLAAVVLVALSLVVFTAGRYGRGVSLTVLDHWVLERLATLRSRG